MKQYTCECGQTFFNAQKFNGHKSSCEVHIKNKYGSIDEYKANKYRNQDKGKSIHQKALKRKEVELQQWVAGKPKCEKCGKIMTQKYGSGRFCSRSCANSHRHTEITKSKIRDSMLSYNVKQKSNVVLDLTEQQEYLQDLPTCEICGCVLSYECRENIACSSKCYAQHFRNIALKRNFGGKNHGAGVSKRGSYKGYWCDSTYELVYIIYNLDHDIRFKRNTQGFEYVYDGTSHVYYPDFMLEDGTFIEIKGYFSDRDKIKLQSVSSKIIILMEDDLKYAFDYVKSNYVYHDLWDLYDN